MANGDNAYARIGRASWGVFAEHSIGWYVRLPARWSLWLPDGLFCVSAVPGLCLPAFVGQWRMTADDLMPSGAWYSEEHATDR